MPFENGGTMIDSLRTIVAMDNLNTVISRLEAWAEFEESDARHYVYYPDPVKVNQATNRAKNYRALVFLIREAARETGLVLH
jgi:hypothetical protein